LLRPGGRTIELAPGQSVLPGLVDSHVHMLEAGVLQLGCPIEDPKSKAVLAAAIEACAAAHPETPWLIGTGWPAALFDELGPRKEELDALVPDRPAVFYGEDGHSAWLNSAALLAADIGPDTEDPLLGRIERRPGSAEPSGTLRETAVDLVEAHVPPTTAEQYAAGLAIGQRHLHGFGITLVQDVPSRPSSVGCARRSPCWASSRGRRMAAVSRPARRLTPSRRSGGAREADGRRVPYRGDRPHWTASARLESAAAHTEAREAADTHAPHAKGAVHDDER
jgi:Amidohydrolase family